MPLNRDREIGFMMGYTAARVDIKPGATRPSVVQWYDDLRAKQEKDAAERREMISVRVWENLKKQGRRSPTVEDCKQAARELGFL